ASRAAGGWPSGACARWTASRMPPRRRAPAPDPGPRAAGFWNRRHLPCFEVFVPCACDAAVDSTAVSLAPRSCHYRRPHDESLSGAGRCFPCSARRQNALLAAERAVRRPSHRLVGGEGAGETQLARAFWPASCKRLRAVASVPGVCTHPPVHRGTPAAAGRLLSRGMAAGPAPAYVELI